ncbi:MAG: STAS domain-containing protein [Actinomycetota bacterium]|nr:STAS domain-containing protein [Actinomycetota bacterium]
MPQAQVVMNVRKPTETVSIIDIEGEVTAFVEEVLNEAHSQASGAGTKAVVLNFNGLEYMNSGGIGLLVTMLIRANRQGQKLAAFGLNDHYRQIFELTRLDEAITIHENEEQALTAAS